jgi:hypothetical protein
MAPWLQFLEAWAVQQLLRTPGFHRAVEKIARRVHRARHGIPPDELGGTNIDQPGNQSNFMKHFMEEIKTQIGAAEQRQQQGVISASQKTPPKPNTSSTPVEEQHNAESVWQYAQRNTVRQEPVKKKSSTTQEDADAAWREALRNGSPEAPKGSFMGEYMSALREQIRQNPKGK